MRTTMVYIRATQYYENVMRIINHSAIIERNKYHEGQPLSEYINT